MMKIKERKKQADYAKRERDIRRRKIQVEQERLTKETDAKKEQENLLKQHLNLMKDVFFYFYFIVTIILSFNEINRISKTVWENGRKLNTKNWFT